MSGRVDIYAQRTCPVTGEKAMTKNTHKIPALLKLTLWWDELDSKEVN